MHKLSSFNNSITDKCFIIGFFDHNKKLFFAKNTFFPLFIIMRFGMSLLFVNIPFYATIEDRLMSVSVNFTKGPDNEQDSYNMLVLPPPGIRLPRRSAQP